MLAVRILASIAKLAGYTNWTRLRFLGTVFNMFTVYYISKICSLFLGWAMGNTYVKNVPSVLTKTVLFFSYCNCNELTTRGNNQLSDHQRRYLLNYNAAFLISRMALRVLPSVLPSVCPSFCPIQGANYKKNLKIILKMFL